MAPVHDSLRTRSQCFIGTFILQPTALIGAILGKLYTDAGFGLSVRQVPGPYNRGPSLTEEVNGERVRLCGTFIPDTSGMVFSVTVVQPLLLGS